MCFLPPTPAAAADNADFRKLHLHLNIHPWVYQHTFFPYGEKPSSSAC